MSVPTVPPADRQPTVDPAAGGPPPAGPYRGRSGVRFAGLLPHLAWEAALLVAVLVLTVVLVAAGNVFGPGQPWGVIALIGFPATAFALSLRTGTPNLAVVGIAGLAGLCYAKLLQEDLPVAVAALLAVVVATLVGLVMGAVAGLLSAPAWAVSLGGLAVVATASWAVAGDGGQPVAVRTGGIAGTGITVFAVLIVLASIAGGLLWCLPRVADLLGGWRDGDDPVAFRPARLMGALVGLTGSSLIAGVGGVVTAAYLHLAMPGAELTRLLPAVGAALLGGVSAFGRRGGILGTALAVTLIGLASLALRRFDAPTYAEFALSALAVFVGLLAGRGLEAVARRFDGARPSSAAR